jgi:hypothetical protein
MAHKLISNKSVVYNAQTLESSYLTITFTRTQFVNNDADNFPGGGGQNPHQVNIQSNMYANLGESGSQPQTGLGGFNYNLTEEEWNTWFFATPFTTTGSYDQVMESSLLYTKSQLPDMFGLTQEDWIYQE